MKDILSLTKRENCFYTVDGRTLCTVKELHNYLHECNPESYYHHASNGKNDFANWVRDVLLFDNLSTGLSNTKTIDEAKLEIKKFVQNFELHASADKKDSSFVTIDDYLLRNLQELYYYLINCDEYDYSQHVSVGKNDFAKWVGEVFMLKNLSQKLYLSNTRLDSINLLKNFLINNSGDEEHKLYFKELSAIEMMNDATVNLSNTNNIRVDNAVLNIPSPIMQSNVSSNISQNVVSNQESPILAKTIYTTVNGKPVSDGIQDFSYIKSSDKSESINNTQPITTEQIIEQSTQSIIQDVVKEQISPNNSSENSQVPKENSPAPASVKSVYVDSNLADSNSLDSIKLGPDGEEKITIKPLGLPEEEDESQDTNNGPLLDPSKFHSFSDEELEKFSVFSRREKNFEEPSVKIEYLKSVYNELHAMIQELRRSEKDALIAELILRSINPKIEYYKLTNDIQDYNHIIRIMKDVQKEIEEASVTQQHNLAEDIFKELRLQGIAMKKA